MVFTILSPCLRAPAALCAALKYSFEFAAFTFVELLCSHFDSVFDLERGFMVSW
jgi:hypothetical protein